MHKIDDIIATKGPDSKITKGRNVDPTPLPTETYTILFDTNGGSQAPPPITVTNGKPYGTLPVPTRQYYEFLGWYTSKSGGSRVTADTRVITGGNHTLYARWIGTAYKVTYNANGGKSSIKFKLINYRSAYGPFTSPERKGYKFKGWYTSKKGGKKVTSATSFTTAKDIILYAGWDKISVKKAASIQLKNKKSNK